LAQESEQGLAGGLPGYKLLLTALANFDNPQITAHKSVFLVPLKIWYSVSYWEVPQKI